MACGIRHEMAVHSWRHWHRRRFLRGSVPRSSVSVREIVLTSLLPSSVMLQQAWAIGSSMANWIRWIAPKCAVCWSHRGCHDGYSQQSGHVWPPPMLSSWCHWCPGTQSHPSFANRALRPFFGPPPIWRKPGRLIRSSYCATASGRTHQR